VRRTVATLLVVASPVLLAAPVGAREGPESGWRSATGPVAIEAPPAAVQTAVPAAPVAVAPPALLTVIPAVPAPVVAAVRPVVKAVRAKASAPAALVDDAAYAARLRADLCQARAIFCGLDRGGRYPAG
jgi:hypothetical protein